MKATVTAVAQATNGRPATVEDVAAILGIGRRGTATQRLVKAHAAGLIGKSGRFGWVPLDWQGTEKGVSGRWRSKPR